MRGTEAYLRLQAFELRSQVSVVCTERLYTPRLYAVRKQGLRTVLSRIPARLSKHSREQLMMKR